MSAPEAADCAGKARPLVALCGVTKQYDDTKALDDVTLDMAPGEFVVLLGPSGAGKSTIFRCVTGLATPETGRVEVLGTSLAGLEGQALRQLRRRVGLIFQQFNLVDRLDAIDNVLAGRLGHAAFWRVMLRRFEARDRQLALANLDRVGLLDKAYQRADSLSGGQQQRVAIARVLTQESELVLADEPVSNLDPETAWEVLRLLKEIARETGIGVLCSLHQVELARRFADRIIGLRDGGIVFQGRPEALDQPTLDRIYRRAATSGRTADRSAALLSSRPQTKLVG